MPDLQVIYIAGFNVKKNTGRNKATREKAAALQRLLPEASFRFIYPGSAKLRLVAYLKVLSFDIYLLFTLLFVDKNARIIQRTTFLPLTNLYLWLRGVKIVYELHTDLKDEIKHYQVSFFEKLVLHGYVFLERLNLRLASAVIYNHPVLQQVMSDRYKKPSIYTYNGANVHDFFPLDKRECRRALKLDEASNYYVFVGSIAKWRGVDLLVEIFNNYMNENDVLLVVGNTRHAYGKEIRSRASEKIIFREEVEVAEIVKYINAADICLVPVKPILKSPGNPLKLYDYIACGKPVIGQEGVMGCADEIEIYVAGIVTDFYEAQQAARDMQLFLKQHDAVHYRRHNRKLAEEVISWDKRMTEWLAFIRQL